MASIDGTEIAGDNKLAKQVLLNTVQSRPSSVTAKTAVIFTGEQISTTALMPTAKDVFLEIPRTRHEAIIGTVYLWQLVGTP